MVNVVSFPGFGWEFTLNRVVIEIFGRPIFWYGLIIAVGFMLGTMLAAHLLEQNGLSEDFVYDFLLWAVPASLVGLRTYYVVFYIDLFRTPDGSLDWGAIFRISDGGMAIYGGIIAGLIALYFYSKKKGIHYFVMSDAICVGVILGQAIGRWGNFMNVEAYGSLTTVPWRMCSSSIATEMAQKGYASSEQVLAIMEGTLGVHPTFFYESFWNLIGFFLLYRIYTQKRAYIGQVTCSYFAWYGFGRFIIEGMRSDSLYFFGLEFMGRPLRTSQMLSLLLCLVAVVFLVQGYRGKVSIFPVASSYFSENTLSKFFMSPDVAAEGSEELEVKEELEKQEGQETNEGQESQSKSEEIENHEST